MAKAAKAVKEARVAAKVRRADNKAAASRVAVSKAEAANRAAAVVRRVVRLAAEAELREDLRVAAEAAGETRSKWSRPYCARYLAFEALAHSCPSVRNLPPVCPVESIELIAALKSNVSAAMEMVVE